MKKVWVVEFRDLYGTEYEIYDTKRDAKLEVSAARSRGFIEPDSRIILYRATLEWSELLEPSS